MQTEVNDHYVLCRCFLMMLIQCFDVITYAVKFVNMTCRFKMVLDLEE